MGTTAAGLFVHDLVVARGAAGLAIHQAVGAEAHVRLRLAEHAILVAPAAGGRLLTLRANEPACRFCGHGCSVERLAWMENVTEVMRKVRSKK